MVDFNNESTVQIKTHELFEKCILEKWYNFISAVGHYHRKESEGFEINIHDLQGRLLELFYSAYGDLSKYWEETKIKEQEDLIYSTSDPRKLIEIFKELNKVLTSINITGTKVDKTVDRDILLIKDDLEVGDDYEDDTTRTT